ncbi:2Fe-2S iron-sulfur cluster-binding protein [Aestuariirhabdus sp. Z084]|uniref:2Fe-2S iron-sulfur cluster-binding protein n=1 Tax=Aestuariirhabdus haliotis TaxID=2918751 RepID=UPI00201B3CD2|nr:2Fe-2S iron-sulfur cluster-binding protein [Aestuariirhabdus haliotis]MCL6417675.1 2Fe-2S iron-sulfur cluster-binding protein [Aestuariirhabdus haliotis]MCL6421598.1 2Fe-2S iron-sulfur cluster-binding protein [Aestuariirhabdus haliotis]
MPTITLIEHSGQDHRIEAVPGKTLMQNALDHLIPGIDADCGGACACGTCHCFIDEQWHPQSGDTSELEASMLAMRPDREPNSRLSCQVTVTEQMDGMVVRLPEYQM